MQFLQKLSQQFGIDKAIFFTSSARLVQGIGGVVTVLFVARYLTGIEQGFYFTFASILAIQVFFELGLNGIITQYVAHESSHLVLCGNKYEGEDKYLSRMASLLHFCVKWYGILATALFLILSLTGFVFFSHFYKAEEAVDWLLPWLVLSFGTTLYFMLSPFIAFIEGLGKVKEVAKIRLVQQLTTILVVWSGLFVGVKLYVGGIGTLVGVVILCHFIFNKYLSLFRSIYSTKITERVSYYGEIFPFQWKIAISWISGYFIFQLFNPVLFATEGAVVAGQMGMTLAILNGIQALSNSWFSTKIPLYSGLIAQKEFQRLDAIFNITLKQSVFICGLSLIAMFSGITIIKYFSISIAGIDLGTRFLDNIPLILMMIPIFTNQFVFSWATYLRCHKQEPFLLYSIVAGVLSACSTIFMGKFYGVIGITAGYTLITLSLFYWSYKIFKTKKYEWHK